MNSQYLNDFYAYLRNEKRYSENTILAYKRDLTLFFEFLKSESIEVPSAINIQSYISKLYLENISPKSICRKLSSIKAYGKYLSKYKEINCDFLSKISSPKKEKKLPEYLHEEEINKLLNLPMNNFLEIRNSLIIHLLYSTGMRLNELANLKIVDYKREQNIFRIKGKGSKERIVIFSKKSKDILDLYLKERKDYSCDYLLINKNNKKLTNRGIQLILKNISLKYLGHDKLHPHMLRHTFATRLLNKGMDIRALQELLGHSNLAATQIYTHLAKSELKEFYQAYHPRVDNESTNLD